MAKKVKITKNTVIKSIKSEYLMPGTWEHDIDAKGNQLTKAKAQNYCTTCAVGAIIVNAKRQGKIKRFGYDFSCANSSHNITTKYLQTLIDAGLPMTALSDKFESECDKADIEGWKWEEALLTIKASKENKLFHSEFDLREAEALVKQYEKEMRKIKRKLIRFVEKYFPFYIEIKEENSDMKEKALKDTLYNIYGFEYSSLKAKNEDHFSSGIGS